MLYKEIHIGQFIKERVAEQEITMERICNFLKKDEEFIEKVYESKSIDTDLLLRWSKLLEYDFFRLYSSHLILYAPPSAVKKDAKKSDKIPYFRKNIYTQEIKNFILKRIQSGEMNQTEIIREYSIPKSTLHRWLQKNTDNNV
ncbi:MULTISPECIES: transposase [Chryseobacterium]|uniref:Transposase n=1 Tax=Chryseobacterium camelliae TaxID=1265445 RepID=A0ABU0TD44_9FLAO|nr:MULTISPECIES: transposase [Chryseobacterium]MDT3407214.1 transposase [Pseudacidovorax intermedius]MDQ1094995.1 transposase [Chryseobacterium camelliae]MDQ1098935.1 transposase [Chryseobacterium sp. SORGH_AS_1048]MDR6086283.1 transposase [Chryseobacterium sp. SORGH_AS_0909]MDR6130655.1 transposase [Chryseobacterium sp. SORGH_AS_1175]